MMNKKGEMVLRNVIFLVLIFSGIIAFASIAVNDIATTYDNPNMSSSYNQDAIGEEQLQETQTAWEDIGKRLDGNFLEMLGGTLLAAKEVLTEVIKAPVTLGNMVANVLTDLSVPTPLANIFRVIIAAGLYVLIIFAIISAFLQGGKL